MEDIQQLRNHIKTAHIDILQKGFKYFFVNIFVINFIIWERIKIKQLRKFTNK